MRTPQLNKLKNEMEMARDDLVQAIYRDFRKYDPKSVIDAGEMNERLRDACEVIDVVGRKEREKLQVQPQLVGQKRAGTRRKWLR